MYLLTGLSQVPEQPAGGPPPEEQICKRNPHSKSVRSMPNPRSAAWNVLLQTHSWFTFKGVVYLKAGCTPMAWYTAMDVQS